MTYDNLIIEFEEKFDQKFNHGIPPILKGNHDYVSSIAKVIVFEGMFKRGISRDDAYKIVCFISEKSELREYIFVFDSSKVKDSIQSKTLARMYDFYIEERKDEDSPLTALAKAGIKIKNQTLVDKYSEYQKDFKEEEKKEEDVGFFSKEKTAEEQFNLAVNYEFGQLGSVQDISKAFSFYTKSAEKGLSKAQHNLALMYENGKGVTINQQKAIYWYTKAAEQGLSLSQFNLAQIYSSDNVGNFTEAIRWYEECKETEFMGKFQLGLLVHMGIGIDKDEDRGLRLLREAAEDGDHTTKLKLADYLSKL